MVLAVPRPPRKLLVYFGFRTNKSGRRTNKFWTAIRAVKLLQPPAQNVVDELPDFLGREIAAVSEDRPKNAPHPAVKAAAPALPARDLQPADLISYR